MIKPKKSHLGNQEKCHPSFKKIRDRNGRENGLFFLALISLSLSPLAILPPLIQTIMDMCFALTFRQTDRHIFISQGTLWRIF